MNVTIVLLLFGIIINVTDFPHAIGYIIIALVLGFISDRDSFMREG